MAVEIGALRALLSLDSAAFENGAKRAQASMNNLQRSLSRTSDRMRKIGRNMTTRVTAPIVAGIGLMSRAAVRNAVEIERLSQVANASTTEFQRFAAAARDVGIEEDKLADILKDTNDRVGDFLTTGAGPMADFFETIAPKVGVTAEQFKGLSGPEALQLYVSSLEKANVNQQEMTFFMEALASDATLLLPLLRDNGREMNRLGDAAENAGLVMDKTTIDALLRTRDAMRDAGDAAKGLFTQIMASLAPVMEAIADSVAEAARWFSDLSPEMKRLVGVAAAVAAAIGPLALTLGLVATGLAAMASPIGLVVLAFGAVAGAAAYVVTQWDNLVAKYPVLGVAAERAGNAISAAWEGMKSVVMAAADIVKSSIDVIVGVLTGDLKRAVDGLRGVWDGWVAATDAAINAVLNIIEAIVPGFRQAVADIIAAVSGLPQRLKQWGMDVIQAFVDGLVQKWQEVKEAVLSIFRLDDVGATAIEAGKKLGSDLGQGTLTGIRQTVPQAKAEIRGYLEGLEGEARDVSETQSPSRVWMRIGRDLMDGLGVGISGNAQKAANAAANAAKGVTDAATNVMSEGQQKISDIFGQIGDGFAGAIARGQDLGDSLKRVFSQIASDFISSGISGLLGSIFGKSSGGGGLFGGLFAGLFDSGGPIPRGQFGIVGERGPEIVTGPARVTSRAQTARIMENSRQSGGAIQVVARVENGNITQHVEQVSGNVAVKVVQQGLTEFSRHHLPGRVKQINNDPRTRG